MGTQANGHVTLTAGDALRAALAKNQTAATVATPAKLTESGTPEATKGVSLQDQVAALTALVTKLTTAPPAKSGKSAKPAKAPKPEPVAETGPWYARKAYLGRCEKETGKPFYDVDFDSVMATEDIAIMRSNAFSDTLLFIKGKRKPVYLSVDAIEALILDFPTLEKWVDANEKYLAQCRADKTADSE